MERIAQVKRKRELSFSSDAGKFRFLEGLLETYWHHQETIESSGRIDYDIRIRTPEGKRLYFSGFDGKPGFRSGCGFGSIMPYTQFMQDIVASRRILEVHNSPEPEAEAFADRLLEYAIFLESKGLIPPPQVRISRVSPKNLAEGADEVAYAALTGAADFITLMKENCEKIWMPKLRANTGEYNSSRVSEIFSLELYR